MRGDATLSSEIKAIFTKVFCTFLSVSEAICRPTSAGDGQQPRIRTKRPFIPTFLSNDDQVECRFAERARNQTIGLSSTISFSIPSFDISRAVKWKCTIPWKTDAFLSLSLSLSLSRTLSFQDSVQSFTSLLILSYCRSYLFFFFILFSTISSKLLSQLFLGFLVDQVEVINLENLCRSISVSI